MTALVEIDTSEQVGGPKHFQKFANAAVVLMAWRLSIRFSNQRRSRFDWQRRHQA